MKTYELTYLISPESSEENIEALQEEIKSLVQEKEGSVSKTQRPAKRKLAYPIENKIEAILVNLTFLLASNKLVFLEKKLKSEKNILRYLIVTKELLKKAKLKRRIKPKPRKLPKAKEKVELKEIEKKLEEILGES